MTPTTAADFGFGDTDVLLVTGAGSGIGRAMTLAALGMGLRVSGWDLNQETLGETERLAASDRFLPVCADVSDAAAVAEGFARTRSTMGPVRYLANNAGPASSSPLDFEDALRVCVGSVRLMTTTWSADPALPEGAAMVVTSSVAGNVVGTASDWYSAAKAALAGYMRHLASSQPVRFRSNAVAPGMTATPRLDGFAESAIGERILGRMPMQRMATPEEIALPALFLLSPLASYVHGAFLPIDGGWTVAQ